MREYRVDKREAGAGRYYTGYCFDFAVRLIKSVLRDSRGFCPLKRTD